MNDTFREQFFANIDASTLGLEMKETIKALFDHRVRSKAVIFDLETLAMPPAEGNSIPTNDAIVAAIRSIPMPKGFPDKNWKFDFVDMPWYKALYEERQPAKPVRPDRRAITLDRHIYKDYMVGLPNGQIPINPDNPLVEELLAIGRRPSFTYHGCQTGRTSSTKPNVFDIHKPSPKPKLHRTKQSRAIFELCAYGEMRMSFAQRRDRKKARNYASMYGARKPFHEIVRHRLVGTIQPSNRHHHQDCELLALANFENLEVRAMAQHNCMVLCGCDSLTSIPMKITLDVRDECACPEAALHPWQKDAIKDFMVKTKHSFMLDGLAVQKCAIVDCENMTQGMYCDQHRR